MSKAFNLRLDGFTFSETDRERLDENMNMNDEDMDGIEADGHISM